MADEQAKKQSTTQDTGLVNNSEHRSDKSTAGDRAASNDKSSGNSQNNGKK